MAGVDLPSPILLSSSPTIQLTTMPKQRIVVSASLPVDDSSSVSEGTVNALNLCMLCCEELPPYGPARETADMFVQLLMMSNARLCSFEDTIQKKRLSSISVTVYHAQHEDYPSTTQEWNSFDGVIIPGSLSSAFDTHIPWIERLHRVIREEIHVNQRRTLAVCFGHQSFAHALGVVASSRKGEAGICPSGKKAGRKSFSMTPVGGRIFAKCSRSQKCEKMSLEMLYTHGDMVNSLPPVGLSLGGNGDVPVQSAAYFASEEDALKYEQSFDVAKEENNFTPPLPYAITFQAHPEFVSPTGFNVNFVNIVQAMKSSNRIDDATAKEACEDAKQTFDRVELDSLDAVISVCRILGWF
jgi:GMP synthase-like glutamine amidotransferase